MKTVKGIAMSSFEEIRKQRRSFEEKLRKNLLFLEERNREKEAKTLIDHLENEMYKETAKYTKYQ